MTLPVLPRASRDELEGRVQVRTAELSGANEQLQREIVEREEAEGAQRRTEARARRLIESNVIGTVVAHLGGQILEANDAFLRLVGCTQGEVQTGQVGFDILTPPEYWPLDSAPSKGCAPLESAHPGRRNSSGETASAFLYCSAWPFSNKIRIRASHLSWI